MDPISTWNTKMVAAWMRGLDPALQDYPFETWGLTGKGLLHLSYRDLEDLGMRRVGHQELLLEAVEQLCVLNYDLATTNLQVLTEKLQGIVRTIQTFILSRRKVSTYDGYTMEKPSSDLLACVVELIGAAKGLFLWLNRYLFSHLNDYSASKDIIWLCGDLAEIMKADCTLSEREDRILLIGRHISGICEHILNYSPAELLHRTAILETVELVAAGPEDSLGIEIKSSPTCLHFISGTAPEVGWTRMNLVKKLLETSSQVTSVLKKIPLVSPGTPSSPESSPLQQKVLGGLFDVVETLSLQSDESATSFASSTSSMAAEVDGRPDFLLGLPADEEEQEATNSWHPDGSLEEPSGAGAFAEPVLEGESLEGSRSPDAVTPARPSTLELESEDSTTPENGFVRGIRGLGPAGSSKEGSVEYRRKQKGMATRLSRRRISCQDLGQVDCDGWLLKKKDHGGFMAQKWKRFWFVLKGQALYWYSNPNDEKAVGFINVSAYRLESKKEQKKKYVFQLTHEKYKPFIFAAETLADLSMWVSRLITSMMKYTPVHKYVPHRQEDCYSETEAEDPEDDSPRHSFDLPKRRELEKDQLLTGAAGNNESPSSSPLGSPLPRQNADHSPASPSPTDPSGEELESLIKCLKQGGVSLIGKQQVFTREYYRKSFVKRNKNPEINEKVHLVRTLQSTLKAKTAELQLLDILLDDSELTSEKFSTWKEQHQELYQEIQAWWAKRVSQEDGARTDYVSDFNPEDTAAAAAP
ncbi:connector enhancer of kinase suppressor of ras 1 isoform X2 [Zootoca vivipara]|uniref:connector enhancer of kinase suppressor of ras 1 isoform X2 n=1 Tax=Zootoca vivipara TaxID=8524 RepID=UPI00293BFA2C|nr:connector enhancer of kinase suppressor of ras 1 isoform X2 [Zootoca vivipara]